MLHVGVAKYQAGALIQTDNKYLESKSSIWFQLMPVISPQNCKEMEYIPTDLLMVFICQHCQCAGVKLTSAGIATQTHRACLARNADKTQLPWYFAHPMRTNSVRTYLLALVQAILQGVDRAISH